MSMTHAMPERYMSGALARVAHDLRAWLLIGMTSALVACGGGGGGGGDDNSPPDTGTLQATVVDEFDAPVAGATVEATINATTRSGTTDDAGVATVTNVGVGSASVQVSLETFETETVTATITANQTTNIDVTLTRNTAGRRRRARRRVSSACQADRRQGHDDPAAVSWSSMRRPRRSRH